MVDSLDKIYERLLQLVAGRSSFENHLKSMPNRIAIILNLLVGVIGLIYLIAHLIQGTNKIILPHILLIAGSMLGVVLSRFGKFDLGKIILMLIFNFVIYLANSSNMYDTGSNLYFFTMIIASYVVFEYEKINYAYFFTGLSFGLYLLSSLLEYSIFPEYGYTPSMVRFHFLFNTTTFTVLTSVILILFIRMINYRIKRINDQNEQLEQSNQELDQFLYSTSHDLRAPLTTVMGLLNVAETTSDPVEKTRYYHLIKDRVEKMDSFIKDIVDLIKNSRLPVENEVFDLRELVQLALEEISSEYNVNGFCIRNQIQDGLFIKSDQKRLITVLNNLLSNAVKYSDKNKNTPSVEVWAQIKSELLRISVKDNGIGIPESQKQKIFEMFHKATEVSKGSGLGLYIVREMIRKLDGNISVESEPGIGSEFTLQIPVKITNVVTR